MSTWSGVIFLSNGKPGITNTYHSRDAAIDTIAKSYYDCDCSVEILRRSNTSEIYVDKILAAEVYENIEESIT